VVTIHLPANVNRSDIRAEAAIDGRNIANGQMIDGRTIQYTAQNVASDDALEVRTQFPHGLVTASPPSWQAATEAAEANAERAKNIASVVNLLALVLGGFVLVGGGLFVLINYVTRGRDPQTQLANSPIVVREPPTDLPPAVVGTLVDERADEQDVIATVVDLATRGIITIEEVKNEKLLGSNLDFRFKLNGDVAAANLRPYEKTLLTGLFGTEQEFMMSDLKGRFFASMQKWMSELYDEVTTSRLFVDNPEAVRQRYRRFGQVLVGLGVLGGVFAVCALTSFGGLAFFPFLCLIGVGVMFMIIAPRMPKRTEEGVRQAIQWEGFRRYLQDIQKHEPVNQAVTLFNRYLPYAVAFGIDKTWVGKFATVGTPAPPWFQSAAFPGSGFGPGPYGRGGGPIVILPGGDWGYPGGGGRHHRGGGGGFGGDGGGGPRNLDEVSGGLTDMLDRASRSLSSGSFGGGGGWGGGGGGGWGGGGGGGGGSSSGFS
jgi:hypothetical protein